MDIKYVRQPASIILSIIWIIIGLAYFWDAGSVFNSQPYLSIFIGILALIIGISFANITRFTYVTLDKFEIIIHGRRFLPWKKKIDYDDINSVEVLGKHIIIHQKNNRTFKLENNYIANDRLAKMREKLTEYGVQMR